MERVHFVGIGGTGLSAIAKVLLEQGYTVSGSDLQASPLLEAVKAAGGTVNVGHDPRLIRGADLVIRSSAVPEDNPEVAAARAAGIPVLKRSEFLGKLTAGKRVLAVAGSHGKTTTSSMLTWILTSQGRDPSFIVGGVVADLGTNAHAGSGADFVIEADEYDRMFLGLKPDLALVTNVEHDHPDLFPTEADFITAFQQFVGQIRAGGTLIVCADDPGALRLADCLRDDRDLLRYGIESGQVDYRGVHLAVNQAAGMDFEIEVQDRDLVPISLRIPGRHNVLNALGAFALADRLGIPGSAISAALGDFSGSGRRFEVRGEFGGVLIVDDYGHHPTEIKATLGAARTSYPDRFIRAVWQPHTYTRTTTLAGDFLQAFQDADQVIILDVYEAREERPEGFQTADLAAGMDHQNALYLPELPQAAAYLEEQLKPGDLVLVFSAGDAIEINDRLEGFLLAESESREENNHGS